MFEFRCTEDGFYYYDPIIREERFASNTLLFLLGYCRTFGDIYVSDKLFIPNTVLNPDGIPVELVNFDFQFAARSYLSSLARVDSTDIGDKFELYGLTLALEKIGFFSFYQSSNSSYSKLNRVPHIPLFTKRSQDYKRIYDILTENEYWGEGDPIKGNPDVSKYDKNTNNRIKQEELYPKYSVYNTEYKGNRAESLELYDSFGSINYMERMYPTELKPVQKYDDMCSWLVWDSLSFTTLYQFSLGALYGMSQLGYGALPYNARPTLYAKGFKYLQYIDEAFFWFQNTPLDLLGSNELFYIDARLFRIDTYEEEQEQVSTGRVLSPSVDQEYLYDSVSNTYSLDNGSTWISLSEFSQWAQEHDGAYPVTDNIMLYLGSTGTQYPMTDWEWPE